MEWFQLQTSENLQWFIFSEFDFCTRNVCLSQNLITPHIASLLVLSCSADKDARGCNVIYSEVIRLKLAVMDIGFFF